jgi:opacity protein-like surface antigen
MKRIIALVIFCSLLSMTSVFSQDKAQSHFSIQYDMSFGTGDLGDYISAPSFRGASAQYRYAVAHNILVGIDAAWNVFYEKRDYDTYTSGTMTLSGVQYRYQNQVPLLVSADYVFTPDKDFQPYVGLGIGTMYTERVTEMGIWYVEENPWQFALKPEVGMLYKFASGGAFKLGVKYYTGFGGDLGTQGYITISAGFAFGF